MDLHHDSYAALALNVQAIASDTTTVGNTIDMAGYEAAEFVIFTKTLTDGDYDIKMYEGEESDMSDEAEVSAAEQLGDPSFTDDTDDNAVARVGYIGKKRYVRLKVVSTNTTTGVDAIGAIVLQSSAHHKPVSDQDG